MTTVAERHLGLSDNHAFGLVDDASIRSMVREVATADVDVVVPFCTNLGAGPRGPGRRRPRPRVCSTSPAGCYCRGSSTFNTHATPTYARGVAEDLGQAPAYTPGVPGPWSLSRDDARAFVRLGVLELALFGSTIGDLYVRSGSGSAKH